MSWSPLDTTILAYTDHVRDLLRCQDAEDVFNQLYHRREKPEKLVE